LGRRQGARKTPSRKRTGEKHASKAKKKKKGGKEGSPRLKGLGHLRAVDGGTIWVTWMAVGRKRGTLVSGGGSRTSRIWEGGRKGQTKVRRSGGEEGEGERWKGKERFFRVSRGGSGKQNGAGARWDKKKEAKKGGEKLKEKSMLGAYPRKPRIKSAQGRIHYT